MKKFTFSNLVRKSLNIFMLGFFLFAGGCYTIAYINQPNEVAPNSAFNVKIAVIPEVGIDLSDYTPGYGILGILLPEGWHVIDSLEYWNTGGYTQKGFYCCNSNVVSFLNNHYGKQTGYYWWGAKSITQIDIAYLDTGYINLTILTNENKGQFKTKYVLGDDNEWHKSGPAAPYGVVQERYLPVKVDDIASHSLNCWKNEDWEVYPNPSKGQITIRQGSFTDEVIMKVYDLNGRLQKSNVLWESLNYVNLSDLSKGTYIISLEKKGEIKTKKLIIQ